MLLSAAHYNHEDELGEQDVSAVVWGTHCGRSAIDWAGGHH